MQTLFCPQAVDWGDVATWASSIAALLAAVATFWAVVVALRSNRKALEMARLIRKDERQEAEEIRRLKAKAYAAIVADDIWRAHRHLSLAADILGFESMPEKERAYSATGELAEIRTDVLRDILQHVEVFDDPTGKTLARLTVSLMEQEQSSQRNMVILKSRNTIPNGFTALLQKQLRKTILKLRLSAPLFYRVAEISSEYRILPPLSNEELEEIKE